MYKLLLMIEKMRHYLNMKNLSALQGEDINKILFGATYLDYHVI